MRPKFFTVIVVAVMAFLLATNPMVGNAAGMITGKQIKNGSVTGQDIKDHTLTAADVSGSITGPTGPTGATGPQGPAGTPGNSGAPGLVRAWAVVSSGGVVKRSAGGVTVTHPTSGTYCITAAGIASTTTAATVSPDYSNDSSIAGANTTGAQTSAEIETTTPFAGGCPSTATTEVDMFLRTFTYSGTGNNKIDATQYADTDAGFTVLIP